MLLKDTTHQYGYRKSKFVSIKITKQVTKNACKWRSFAVNYTADAESLCPALLVFRLVPRLGQTMPAPSPLERAKVIDFAMDNIAKKRARRISFNDLKHTKEKTA